MVDVVRGGDDADAKEQVADAAPTLTGDDDDDGFGTFKTAADDDANVDVEGSKAGEQSEEQAPVAELSGDNGAGSDDEWGDFETPGEENVAAAAAVAESYDKSEADNAKDQPAAVPVPIDPDTDGTIRSYPDAAFEYHEDSTAFT